MQNPVFFQSQDVVGIPVSCLFAPNPYLWTLQSAVIIETEADREKRLKLPKQGSSGVILGVRDPLNNYVEVLVKDLPEGISVVSPQPFDLLVGTPDKARQPVKLDRRTVRDGMRNAFFQANSNTALCEFLAKWGEWGGPHGLAAYLVVAPGTLDSLWYSSLRHTDDEEPIFVLPSELTKTQNILKAGLNKSRPPGEWLSLSAFLRGAFAKTSSEFPYFSVTQTTCYACLDAINTIDRLTGVDIGYCAREDCNIPFARSKRKGHKHCSESCQHLAFMRRQRKNKGKSLLG